MTNNTDTASTRDTTIIFLLVLFSLNFFSAAFAHSGIFKALTYAFLLGIIIVSAPLMFCANIGFIFPVKLICLSIVLSVFMSYLSWDQELSYAVSAIPYMTWIAFFYLIRIKYPIYNLERIVLLYGILYIVLFSFQFLNSDVVYFGYKEEFIEDRGIVRVDFPGGGIFYLSYFICLTKAFTKSRINWLFAIAVLIGLSITFLQVTRQSIVAILLVSLFHILKFVSIGRKLALVSLLSLAVILFFGSDNSISKGLIAQQKETSSEGSEYIRVLAGEFFLTQFSPTEISKILGNGLPNNNSDYGKYTVHLQEFYGFHISDVGLIGFYAMFGILPIIAYLILFSKGYILHVPDKYYYVKYYFAFLLLTSLTSDYSYSWNYLFTTVFVLYTYQRIYEDRQNSL